MKSLDVNGAVGFVTGIACGVIFGWIAKGILTKKQEHKHDGPKQKTIGIEEEPDCKSIVESDQYKLVIAVRQDLKMGKGKVAAQCSHAALGAYKKLCTKNKALLKQWEYGGQPKVVVKCSDEEQLLALFQHARTIGLTTTIIEDAGRTQISPGSKTVLAVGPGSDDDVNKVTGHLKLL